MNQQDDELDVMLEARQYICPICKKKFSIPLYVSTSRCCLYMTGKRKRSYRRNAAAIHVTEKVNSKLRVYTIQNCIIRM